MTRGCSPRRPAADTRYEPASETTEPGASARIFTVRGRRPVHRRRPVLLATTAPISAPYAFQGCSVASTEKTTLHGSSAGFSGLVVGSLRRVVRTWQVNVSYSPGPGILTGFPFAMSNRSRLSGSAPPSTSSRLRGARGGRDRRLACGPCDRPPQRIPTLSRGSHAQRGPGPDRPTPPRLKRARGRFRRNARAARPLRDRPPRTG